MSRVTRTLIALVALVVLNLSTVLAQDDEALQRYEAALANLQQSVEMLPADAGASLDALARADAALRRLSQDTASASLIEAMERVFDNARAAVQNRSSADLAVQAAVLRGGFQRGLLEASLAAGEPSEARDGIRRLAGDLGLDLATVEAIGEAPDVSSLLRHYQAGVARGVAQRIDLAAGQLDESLETSYVTLAGAYGMFLSLQDSPHAPADLNEDFLALVNALVSSESAEVNARAGDLSAAFAGLSESLGAAAEAAEPTPDTEPAPTQPVTEPEAIPTEEAPAEPTAPAEPADPAPADVPASESPEDAAGDPAGTDAPAAPDSDAPGSEPPVAAGPSVPDLEAAAETLRQQDLEQRGSAITAELAMRGLRGQPAEAAANQLLTQGYTSLSGAVDSHYALAARFADAVSKGDDLDARAHLTSFEGLFGTSLALILNRTAPELVTQTNTLINSLRDAPTLRQSDANALIDQTAAADAGLSGTRAGMLSQAEAGVSTYFGGWPRLVVIVLLALLAILPLVLLRIAFGTGNRNWGQIGAGLFLLLLPLMLDGLGQVAALVGSLTGIGTLNQVASWLTLSTPIGEAVWLLLMLCAIMLLSVGLYGICKQFGLFGGREPGQRASRKHDSKPETKTLVDWDEEF